MNVMYYKNEKQLCRCTSQNLDFGLNSLMMNLVQFGTFFKKFMLI